MNKSLFFILVTIVLLTSIVISKTYLLTNSTLLENAHWQSTKSQLEMGVMGSWNFISQTQPLNKERLNLGAWHGFQEVISHNSYEYTGLNIDFYLEPDAYIIFHYNISDNIKESLRLGTDSELNNCLVIAEDGEFIKKKPIESLNIPSNQTHKLTAKVLQNEISFRIDDDSFSCQFTKMNESKIGFRGGLNNSYLDNIELKKESKLVFIDQFSNSNNLISLTCLIFLCILIINIIFIQLLKKKNQKKLHAIFFIISLNISVLLSLFVYYYYLLNHFTGNYPNIKSLFSQLHRQEEAWVDNEVEILSAEIMQNFSSDPSQKIMFIGSSQTWGAGASTKDKSFPLLFENELNKLLTNPSTASQTAEILGLKPEMVKVVNTGISGTTTNELLNEYKNNWSNLNPNIVFINLSSNDYTYGIPVATFEKNIEEFIRINSKKNIRTILLIEAQSPEYMNENNYHEVLLKIAENNSIPVIDINATLKEKNQTGLIWWDFIHLSDYGHTLVAQEIIDYILVPTDFENIHGNIFTD